jgi:two-component system, response regulator
MQTQVDILMVEDKPEDHILTVFALLNAESNKIHLVRDGEEALSYIFCKDAYAHRNIEDQPRMILLDRNLRMVNGLEVLRRIRGDPRTQSIPVVMLSASERESDLVEAYRLGVNSYVVKPTDSSEFKQAVRMIATYWLQLNRSSSIGGGPN